MKRDYKFMNVGVCISSMGFRVQLKSSQFVHHPYPPYCAVEGCALYSCAPMNICMSTTCGERRQMHSGV